MNITEMSTIKCSFEGCLNIIHGNNLCVAHLMQLIRLGNLKPLQPKGWRGKLPDHPVCGYRECEKPTAMFYRRGVVNYYKLCWFHKRHPLS